MSKFKKYSIFGLLTMSSVCTFNNSGFAKSLSPFDFEGTVMSANSRVPSYLNTTDRQVIASTVALMSSSFKFRRSGGISDPVISPFCSGTLIGPRVVLTAAHCAILANAGTSSLVGYGVTPSFDERQEDGLVAGIYVHPEERVPRNGSIQPGAMTYAMNDLAIVFLQEDAPAGFVPVPLARQEVEPGELLVVAGFGKDEYGNPLKMMHSTSGLALGYLPELKFIVKDQLSWTGEICPGDSGGPAFTINQMGGLTLSGVTSMGMGHCVGGGTGFFTSVTAYYDWIRDSVHKAGYTLAQ